MFIYDKVITKYKPKDRKELRDLILEPSIKLYEIDTSLITDMSGLFVDSGRNSDDLYYGVEFWDMSNVENITHMFYECFYFNRPIYTWDVSNIKYSAEAFAYCTSFNIDLSVWNTKNMVDCSDMFYFCKALDKDFSKWKLPNEVTVYNMFAGTKIENNAEYMPKYID